MACPTSHIDALCHVFVDEQMYNGFGAAEVKSTGARRGSIMCAKDGVWLAGECCSIFQGLLNTTHLEPGTPVMIADLEAAEATQGVQVGVGDILLIGTGA